MWLRCSTVDDTHALSTGLQVPFFVRMTRSRGSTLHGKLSTAGSRYHRIDRPPTTFDHVLMIVTPWWWMSLVVVIAAVASVTSVTTGVVAQLQLTPVGTVATPVSHTELGQMAFDPVNQTLYVANTARHTIVHVVNFDSVPLAPFSGAPWTLAVLAGRDGRLGSVNATEVRADVATFNVPSGVSGWPTYALCGAPSPMRRTG